METLYSTIYYSKYFIELNIDKSTQYVAFELKTPHTSPFRASYGVSFMNTSTEIDRVIKGFYCILKIMFSIGDLLCFMVIWYNLDLQYSAGSFRWLAFRCYTVETLYYTVNFCWSTHKRHSIAHPKGRGILCVQRATYCVDLSKLSSIKYLL